MPSPSKVWVFDVDGPIYDGHLIVDFVRHLAKRGHFKPDAFGRFMNALSDYATGKLSYRKTATLALTIYGEGIEGERSEYLFEQARVFVRENRQKFFPGSLEFIRKIKATGKRVALLSLSPDELISAMRSALGIDFDFFIGSHFSVKNGVFTGKAKRAQIVEFKRDRLERVSKVFKVETGAMRMVGDSRSDHAAARGAHVPFVAMNPDNELERVLTRWKARGGKPRVFRTHPVLRRH